MEKCPKCGRYMYFHMEYSNGYPFIYYTCCCGYSTRNEYSRGYYTSTDIGVIKDYGY